MCTALANRPGSTSFGRFFGSNEATAISLMESVWLVVPDENTPSSNLRSASATLSMWAAMVRALATIFSVARWKAEPAMLDEREPPVPSPKNTWSVSPCT